MAVFRTKPLWPNAGHLTADSPCCHSGHNFLYLGWHVKCQIHFIKQLPRPALYTTLTPLEGLYTGRCEESLGMVIEVGA